MRRCEVCFAPLPEWAEAYLWPCAHGGLTVCADCFVAPGAGAAAVCTGSVRGTKEKPAHGVDGQAGHVRFFFAVLTEAIKIFFSSMHLLSISVSLLYPLSMSNSIQYSVSEHSFRAI